MLAALKIGLNSEGDVLDKVLDKKSLKNVCY